MFFNPHTREIYMMQKHIYIFYIRVCKIMGNTKNGEQEKTQLFIVKTGCIIMQNIIQACFNSQNVVPYFILEWQLVLRINILFLVFDFVQDADRICRSFINSGLFSSLSDICVDVPCSLRPAEE